jgi:hypothetical protein
MHPYTPNLYTLNNNPPSNYDFFFEFGKKGTKQEDERDEDLQIIV